MPAVKDYCAKYKLAYKTLLLIDQGHQSRIADIGPEIKVVFLPFYTTAHLQPMNQVAYYLKKCLSQTVNANNENEIYLKILEKF